MPQTYPHLKRHIAELQAQAEAVKRSEVAGVIAKAKDAINFYGLTRQDLFDMKAARAVNGTKAATGKKGKGAEAKYADGKGGFWVGRGKRPRWLSELLAAGGKLEHFLLDKVSASAPAVELAPAPVTPAVTAEPAAPKKRAVKKAARKAVAEVAKPAKASKADKAGKSTKVEAAPKAKYRDEAGNSWSGRGPVPKWLKTAIAGGKKLEAFQG